MADLEALRGKTLTSVEVNDASDVIDFRTADGGHWRMYHSQDCCESVRIEDIEGDIQSLVGSPLLVAEEVEGEALPPLSEWEESYTWTFYKLATIKGHVDIRWYGSSNGYYSERVSFQDMNDPKDYGW